MRSLCLVAAIAALAASACGSSHGAMTDVGRDPLDGSASEASVPPDAASGDAGGLSTSLGHCTVFPPWTKGSSGEDYWNADVSALPVDVNSDTYIAYMNGGAGKSRLAHPDFGSSPANGIPYASVPGTQPRVPMTFDYVCESDPGPYPFPPDAPIESGCDHHVLIIDRDQCVLYETFGSMFLGAPSDGWHCGAGASFDLTSSKLRPDGWTSADAAGLPVFAGLVRYDEVAAGTIQHALRFTMVQTQRGYVHPATHFASSITDSAAPPMGLRLRLKASYDFSAAPPQSKVILQALATYGMMLADNGSNFFLSGEPDPRFDDCDLGYIKSVPGTAFEVVQLVAPIQH